MCAEITVTGFFTRFSSKRNAPEEAFLLSRLLLFSRLFYSVLVFVFFKQLGMFIV